MGIRQAPGRNRLIDPPMRKAIPRMRNDETCVNLVLINASVLQIKMAVSARIMPVRCCDEVFMDDLSFVKMPGLIKILRDEFTPDSDARIPSSAVCNKKSTSRERCRLVGAEGLEPPTLRM